MAQPDEQFDIDRHLSVAQMLVRASSELSDLQVDLRASFGPSVAERAGEAIAALGRLRSELDRRLDRGIYRAPDHVSDVRIASIYFPSTGLARKVA